MSARFEPKTIGEVREILQEVWEFPNVEGGFSQLPFATGMEQLFPVVCAIDVAAKTALANLNSPSIEELKKDIINTINRYEKLELIISEAKIKLGHLHEVKNNIDMNSSFNLHPDRLKEINVAIEGISQKITLIQTIYLEKGTILTYLPDRIQLLRDNLLKINQGK